MDEVKALRSWSVRLVQGTGEGRIARLAGFTQGPVTGVARPQREPCLQSLSLDSLIATLNTIELGNVDEIRARLLEIREELEQRELAELVGKLDQSLSALGRGDLQDFRRLKATIVSRLGHLR